MLGATTPSDRVLLGAVDAIYAAVVEPGGWQAVLESLVDMTGGEVGALVEHRLGTRSDVVHELFGVDDTWRHLYEHDWAPRNIYLHAGKGPVRAGAVRLSQELVPLREALLTDYVNDFLLRGGMLHIMGSVLAVEAESAVIIHLLRSSGKDSFDPGHVQIMQTLMAHLQRAHAIRQHLGETDLRHRAALEGLDALNAGVLFLDDHGTVLFANRAAELLLAQADGLGVAAGVLHAADPRQSAALARAINAACDRTASLAATSPGAFLITRPSGRRPFVVVVAPLAGEVPGVRQRGPAAIAFVTDPQATASDPEAILRYLYGLTPAEARVAGLLVQGHDLTTLTDHLGVTANTARTHVKRLLAKTETQNQRELLRMLIAVTTASPSRGRAPAGAPTPVAESVGRRREVQHAGTLHGARREAAPPLTPLAFAPPGGRFSGGDRGALGPLAGPGCRTLR